MRNKYKIKRKRNLISVYGILAIFITIILGTTITYSKFSEDLTVHGYVFGEQIEEGTVYASNLKVSIDSDGILTLNGNINDGKNYFVKFSNGFEVTTANSTESIFNNWFSKDDTILASSGEKVLHSVEVLSGSWNTDKDLNVVIRDNLNTAVLNCQLSKGIYEQNLVLNSDARVHYLYLQAGLKCKDVKLKTTIQKDITLVEDRQIKLIPSTTTFNGITCTIDNQKRVIIDGTAKGNMFIKLSNGIAASTNANKEWISNGNVFGNTGENLDFKMEVLSGSITGSEFNVCLRGTDNKMYTALKLYNNEFERSMVLDKDVCVLYIYISKGVICDNYVITPSITAQPSE